MSEKWTLSYLQSVLAGKAFVAVHARVWLDSQMDALMTLQVVVSVEALWALIALEWAIIVGRRVGLMRVVVVHGLHICCVTTIEAPNQSLR